MNDQYTHREVHRKATLKANQEDRKQGAKNETLQEWFDREKKKAEPK